MLQIFYKTQITVVVSPDRDIACWSNLGMVYSALTEEEEEEEEQLDKILCLKKNQFVSQTSPPLSDKKHKEL